MKYGHITVASAIPQVKVGDTHYNAESIISLMYRLNANNAEIAVFPELCVTGYSCQDLFRQSTMIDGAELALSHILERTRRLTTIFIIGMPIRVDSSLYNCAVVIQNGDICGIIAKHYLPNYNEFYEQRWFASASTLSPNNEVCLAGRRLNISSDPIVFATSDNVKFGIEICEDVWAPIPPSSKLTLLGADIIFNLSASDELVGKNAYLKSLLSQQSARTISGYVYSSCGYGESTQDVVYGGNALIYENGALLAEGERFVITPQFAIGQIDIERLRAERQNNTTFTEQKRGQLGNARLTHLSPTNIETKLTRVYNKHPFLSKNKDNYSDILNIQTLGLMKRIAHIGIKKVIIGVSGGSDSTLALLICISAFDRLKLDRRGIIGVTMPGFGTTDQTYQNAIKMMELFGITSIEIPIVNSVRQHFKDIDQDESNHDVTYENCQARERTQILMDIANKEGGIVIGTGDLSELALGWCTYNADHMSMYAVNVSIPKTLVKELMKHYASQLDGEIADVIMNVIGQPVSPELLPPNEDGTIQQITEDNIGPYELHDFFLYHFIRFGFHPLKLLFLAIHAFQGAYDEETVKKWLKVFLKRFFSQQFKRSCLPDGPKVGSVSLSPRGD